MRKNYTEADYVAVLKRIGKKECHSVNIQKASTPSIYGIYRNKLEYSFGQKCELDKRTEHIKDYGYETMTLKLAKGKYHRPDFTIWHLDGTIEQAAVKGYHKNLRDSMTHLIWAAQVHPWFRFTIKRRSGGGWESKELTP